MAAMPANYTVIFSHPSGATATFIYEDGEMSALAKGLDPQQFWTFKQVKAYLLRNNEDDLDTSIAMMAQIGFTAQVMRALPDLLASLPEAGAEGAIGGEGGVPEVHYRTLHYDEFAPFKRYGHSHGEVHWRENEPVMPPPPHRAPALAVRGSVSQPLRQWQNQQSAATHGEVHWREEREEQA
jgi:hypothetical protein